jgi:hypothetical protein
MSTPTQSITERPYGHEVTFIRREPRTGKFEHKRIHRIGFASNVTRAAQLISGFYEIVGVVPYTREQYERCFGVPRRS